MNKNLVVLDDFSNSLSRRRYRDGFIGEPLLMDQYENGQQCGGCSFFAPFNMDYGLCCNGKSPHKTETVFEHFTCEKISLEGWGAHSFSETKDRDGDQETGVVEINSQADGH